jgi:GntR family transcriptional regulator
MQLYVNPSAEVPIYLQIVRQIAEKIAAGKLPADSRLPSHRDLAEQLVIAPMTVKRAYDELEQLGFLETRRGLGTFVSASHPKLDRSPRRDRAKAAARMFLSQAYQEGISFAEAMKLLKEADAELARERLDKEKP